MSAGLMIGIGQMFLPVYWSMKKAGQFVLIVPEAGRLLVCAAAGMLI